MANPPAPTIDPKTDARGFRSIAATSGIKAAILEAVAKSYDEPIRGIVNQAARANREVGNLLTAAADRLEAL